MNNKETQLQSLAFKVKNEQDEKIIEFSSKLSTYEDCLEKMNINGTQIPPMSLQITDFSKLSAYENRLDNMSFNSIYKFEKAMKEHKEIRNTKIDTNIDDLKAEASICINNKFSPPNSKKSPYSSNQPSADINKCQFLNSLYFYSHASQFTKKYHP